MTTPNQEEQIYRLAVSLLINTLSESLLRNLTQKQTDPERVPDKKVRTIEGVINLQYGTFFSDANGSRWERIPAGIRSTKNGTVHGPGIASLPVTVIYTPPAQEEDPAVLRTIGDLERQPRGTVIRSANTVVFERGLGFNWYVTGASGTHRSEEIQLPARVLS